MKYCSPSKQVKQIRLQRRQSLKRRIRKAIHLKKLDRLPIRFRGHIRFHCPSILSIERNFEKSIIFLNELKELSRHILERRRYRATTPIRYSIGLANLEEVSVRRAVILGAEIDRLRRIAGHRLYYEGEITEANEAISFLAQIGLFKLIGDSNAMVTNPEFIHGHRAAIALISGRKCENAKFIEFERSVQNIFEEFETTDYVHCGMAEAMLNVVNHAYLNKLPLKYPCPEKRWWASAVLDGDRSELKVVVFDQGHGIAKTLPSSGFFEKMKLTLAGISKMMPVGSKSPEELLVLSALEFARTRTGEDQRGKGFRDIQLPVDVVKGTRLRITSGNAEVTLKRGCDTVSKPLSAHIGGTLIEWMFPVDSFSKATRS